MEHHGKKEFNNILTAALLYFSFFFFFFGSVILSTHSESDRKKDTACDSSISLLAYKYRIHCAHDNHWAQSGHAIT